MARKAHERGMLQAIVASAMVKFRVNKTTKPETKTKAVEAAMKALGDKDPGRARQIMNWMLNHEYKATEIAGRLKEKATAKTTARKATPTARRTSGTKKPAAAEEAKAAA